VRLSSRGAPASFNQMEERKRRSASLDASLARRLADIAAGRVRDADTVFEARHIEMGQQRSEP
jgi:hypothetical protein